MNDEGTRTLCEALKANTTLTTLIFECVQQWQNDKNHEGEYLKTLMDMAKTANNVGVEGGKALSEVLKVNTTMTALKLDGEQQLYDIRKSAPQQQAKQTRSMLKECVHCSRR